MTSAYESGRVPTIEVRHRLRIAREFAGLDQEALAARSGIARATISNAENGQGTPRRTTINAWALAWATVSPAMTAVVVVVSAAPEDPPVKRTNPDRAASIRTRTGRTSRRRDEVEVMVLT